MKNIDFQVLFSFSYLLVIHSKNGACLLKGKKMQLLCFLKKDTIA